MNNQWQALASSAISRVRYDIETGTMEIEFPSGQTYTYPNVPSSVYNGLLAAPSPGRYYFREIKGVYG